MNDKLDTTQKIKDHINSLELIQNLREQYRYINIDIDAIVDLFNYNIAPTLRNRTKSEIEEEFNAYLKKEVSDEKARAAAKAVKAKVGRPVNRPMRATERKLIKGTKQNDATQCTTGIQCYPGDNPYIIRNGGKKSKKYRKKSKKHTKKHRKKSKKSRKGRIPHKKSRNKRR